MSDSGQSTNPPKPANQNKLVVILIVLFALLLIFAGVIIFLLTRPKPEPEKKPTGGRGTVITEENVSSVEAEVAEKETAGDDLYVTSMSIDWHFNGSSSTDAYVANAVENTRTVYFDLYLVDTGEIIYSSPYIPVGEELNGVTLDKTLDPGTYDTILVYHLVDDDENELSTLSIALTIYVE